MTARKTRRTSWFRSSIRKLALACTAAISPPYLLEVSMDADSELICALETLAGNGDEGADAKALIEAEEAAHNNDVRSLSIDSAGFRGDLLHALSEDEQGPQLEVFVPPYHWPHYSPDLYRRKIFNSSVAGAELTCPGGHTTRIALAPATIRDGSFAFAKRIA